MSNNVTFNAAKPVYSGKWVQSACNCRTGGAGQNFCPKDTCVKSADGSQVAVPSRGGKSDCGQGLTCPKLAARIRWECFSFDKDKTCSIGLTEDGKDPLISGKQSICSYSCTYDKTLIQTADQWKQLLEKCVLNDDDKDNILTSNYCALTSTDCSEYDGVVAKNCSRLISKDFEECNVYNNEYNKITDSLKQDYSNKNPKNPDTACILRADDPDYSLVKNQLPVDDGCWYIPCQTPTKILQTTDKKIQDPSCPDNICQQVYNLPASTQVEISKNKNILQCGNVPSGGGGSGGGGSGGGDSGNQKNSKTIIIVFSIVGGIMVLALFLFLLYRYNKKNSNKQQSSKKKQSSRVQAKKQSSPAQAKKQSSPAQKKK